MAGHGRYISCEYHRERRCEHQLLVSFSCSLATTTDSWRNASFSIVLQHINDVMKCDAILYIYCVVCGCVGLSTAGSSCTDIIQRI